MGRISSTYHEDDRSLCLAPLLRVDTVVQGRLSKAKRAFLQNIWSCSTTVMFACNVAYQCGCQHSLLYGSRIMCSSSGEVNVAMSRNSPFWPYHVIRRSVVRPPPTGGAQKALGAYLVGHLVCGTCLVSTDILVVLVHTDHYGTPRPKLSLNTSKYSNSS